MQTIHLVGIYYDSQLRKNGSAQRKEWYEMEEKAMGNNGMGGDRSRSVLLAAMGWCC